MKDLKEYIKEEIFATPANTIGMGGITFPNGNTPGSGDIPTCIDIQTGKMYKRRKKFKRYKVQV